MEALVAAVIGVLTAAGVYLTLRPRAFDLLLGLTLLTYAVNLFVFAMGRLRIGRPPLLAGDLPPTLAAYADPLPQALVLTAIVISFGMTAVLVALTVRQQQGAADDRTDRDAP